MDCSWAATCWFMTGGEAREQPDSKPVTSGGIISYKQGCKSMKSSEKKTSLKMIKLCETCSKYF